MRATVSFCPKRLMDVSTEHKSKSFQEATDPPATGIIHHTNVLNCVAQAPHGHRSQAHTDFCLQLHRCPIQEEMD